MKKSLNLLMVLVTFLVYLKEGIGQFPQTKDKPSGKILRCRDIDWSYTGSGAGMLRVIEEKYDPSTGKGMVYFIPVQNILYIIEEK